VDFNKLTIKRQEGCRRCVQTMPAAPRHPGDARHLLASRCRPGLSPTGRASAPGPRQKVAALPPSREGTSSRTHRPPCHECSTRADAERKRWRTSTSLDRASVPRAEPVPRSEIEAWIQKVRGGPTRHLPGSKGTYQAPAKFGIDCRGRRGGKLDPVIGRDEEIRRVIRS